jgi:hypothetical protein
MAKTRYIHLQWKGPYALTQLSELQDESRDYGVYQINGDIQYMDL